VRQALIRFSACRGFDRFTVSREAHDSARPYAYLSPWRTVGRGQNAEDQALATETMDTIVSHSQESAAAKQRSLAHDRAMSLDRPRDQANAVPLLPGTNYPALRHVPPVRIYKPSRSVTQSAPGRRYWILEFERTIPSFIEPLMGWTGSADPFAQIRLQFPDRASAVAFARKNGWPWTM
jgi:hypothetical protein